MSVLDSEIKCKLREMGVGSLIDALKTQDYTLTLGMVFEERVKLAVGDAQATFTHSKVDGLIRRASVPYPNPDLRRFNLLEQRGLDRGVIAQLGTCQFIAREQNVVFQGSTGSGSPTSDPCSRSEPASTATARTTSACRTSKSPGLRQETGPEGRRSGCASMRRSHSS